MDEDEPFLISVLKLVCRKYMPNLEDLRIIECKTWLLGHIEELLHAKRENFVGAMKDWIAKTEASMKKETAKKKKNPEIDDQKQDLEIVRYQISFMYLELIGNCM